jgi:hypothetical protein
MQGRAQYTGGKTPDYRGDAARSRAATDRATGQGRTGETMLRDPGPQQIEPLAEAAKGGTSASAALPLCRDGRIASFISGSHIMRRHNESNQGQRPGPSASHRRGRLALQG